MPLSGGGEGAGTARTMLSATLAKVIDDLHLRFSSDPVALHCTDKKHQAALGIFGSFGVTTGG